MSNRSAVKGERDVRQSGGVARRARCRVGRLSVALAAQPAAPRSVDRSVQRLHRLHAAARVRHVERPGLRAGQSDRDAARLLPKPAAAGGQLHGCVVVLRERAAALQLVSDDAVGSHLRAYAPAAVEG